MDILALLGIQQGKRGLVMPWLLWLVLAIWCSRRHQSRYSHHSDDYYFQDYMFLHFHISHSLHSDFHPLVNLFPRYLLEVVTFVAVIVVSMASPLQNSQ